MAYLFRTLAIFRPPPRQTDTTHRRTDSALSHPTRGIPL